MQCWLRDPVPPTLTRLRTRGQLQVSITWSKQPASSVCITCWRRKTTESARGQKQQPGEEEFIKRKGKGSKACLCKGRASGKPSCNPQPQRVGAGAMPTQPPPCWLSPQLSCPSKRYLGTLVHPPSGAAGLWHRSFTKLDAFNPQQHHLLLLLGHLGSSGPWGQASVFLEPKTLRGGTPLVLVAPRLSIPSGMQASEFPAKELEPTSKGFTASNLSIS